MDDFRSESLLKHFGQVRLICKGSPNFKGEGTYIWWHTSAPYMQENLSSCEISTCMLTCDSFILTCSIIIMLSCDLNYVASLHNNVAC